VAIHVAMLSGVAVYHAEGGVSVSDGQVRVANRAGVGSTSVLGPAVKRKKGTVSFDSLSGTAIVTISAGHMDDRDRKSTRLNSSHVSISYAVFCLKKKDTHGAAE